MALADAGARQNPFIAGIHHALKVGIGQDAFGDVIAPSSDVSRTLWHRWHLAFSRPPERALAFRPLYHTAMRRKWRRGDGGDREHFLCSSGDSMMLFSPHLHFLHFSTCS